MKIDRYVAVEMKAFGQGMQKLFEGVAEVFSAIGAEEPDRLVLEKAKWKHEGKDSGIPAADEKVEETCKPADAAEEAPTVDSAPEQQTEKPAKVQAEESVKEPAKGKAETTTIAKEDIQKIIVKKVKQDRSNSAKIEELLHSYGASSVSELPTSKYEAFLTDIAAI